MWCLVEGSVWFKRCDIICLRLLFQVPGISLGRLSLRLGEFSKADVTTRIDLSDVIVSSTIVRVWFRVNGPNLTPGKLKSKR